MRVAVDDLTEEQRTKVINYVVAVFNSGGNIAIAEPRRNDAAEVPPIERLPGLAGKLTAESSAAEFQAVADELVEELGDQMGAIFAAMRVLNRERVTPQRQSLVRGALLTAGTAAFEVLYAALWSWRRARIDSSNALRASTMSE
jgi:hypothetical protein